MENTYMNLDLTERLVGQGEHCGIYHVSGTGKIISWADFATEIFACSKTDRPQNIVIKPIPSSEYPTPAKRPAYSVLETEKFEKNFQTNIPNWQDGLKAALVEWVGTQ